MPTRNRWGPVSRDRSPRDRTSFGPIMWSDDVPSSWGAVLWLSVWIGFCFLTIWPVKSLQWSVRASETNTPESERILCAMADKSDPRMPSAARPYVPALVDPNDLPIDYSSILAIIFGIAGVMMRVRFSCFSFAFWNPIFLCFFFLFGFFGCLGWQQSVGIRIFDSRALFVVSWVGATFFLRWSVFISSSSLCFCSDLGLGFLGFGGGRDIRSLQVASRRHLWVNSNFSWKSWSSAFPSFFDSGERRCFSDLRRSCFLFSDEVALSKCLAWQALNFGGFLGGWWQQKAASFLSLVFIAQALANMKNLENDLKQIVMALT